MSQSPGQLLRSDCPIAAVLDILGDKWTLLIVRDILIEHRHRYHEFVAMDEHIPESVLADRLKRLVAYEILDKQAYQNNPPRYEYHLTAKGKELEPILRDMIRWGLKHVPGTGKSKGY